MLYWTALSSEVSLIFVLSIYIDEGVQNITNTSEYSTVQYTITF